MNPKLHDRPVFKKKAEVGGTLIELMVAMLILAVGLGALTTLFVGSMLTDNRNSKDTTATQLAQKVIEELTAQNVNATVAVTLTDCVGNNWQIPATQGAAFPGQGANLMQNAASPYYGGIDFTQAVGAVPAGFGMQYVDCDPNGAQTTYDVRWNIMTMTANNSRLITASARRLGTSAGGSTGGQGGLVYSVPVTLRAIGGS
jgi:type II secretory pathway pseudopilin PulG